MLLYPKLLVFSNITTMNYLQKLNIYTVFVHTLIFINWNNIDNIEKQQQSFYQTPSKGYPKFKLLINGASKLIGQRLGLMMSFVIIFFINKIEH